MGWMMEQMKLSKHKKFGASSEKSEYDQLSFFNEAETEVNPSIPEPKFEEIEVNYKRKKQVGKKKLNLNRICGFIEPVGRKESIVIYEYQPDRKYDRPKAFLKDFKGYSNSHGYEAYHGLSAGVVICGCFAHARRKFDEAFKILKH